MLDPSDRELERQVGRVLTRTEMEPVFEPHLSF
jgi:hypothetical protein